MYESVERSHSSANSNACTRGAEVQRFHIVNTEEYCPIDKHRGPNFSSEVPLYGERLFIPASGAFLLRETGMNLEAFQEGGGFRGRNTKTTIRQFECAILQKKLTGAARCESEIGVPAKNSTFNYRSNSRFRGAAV